MIRVLVVDDHDLVRTGITRMLADIDGLQVVGEGDSGESALKLARELKPDVVLMDVKMPGIGGLEATRKLLRSHPDIKVVAVTVCEEDPFRECQFFCVRADNGLPPGRPGFYQVGLINRSPYRIAN
ncbi:Protein-glutamate methylesterase/protein-glutamine glutaminase [Pseudomonas sp. Nvir]|nr:Protein-glutamate methylesterase/protein-glutamine glutaminase [Pseudomonas sp. Nvir]